MANETNNRIDRICIEKYSPEGYGEAVIEDPKALKKLAGLMEGNRQYEKCPHFVENPRSISFRIEFYNGQEQCKKIGVVGSYIFLDNEWYWTNDSSLEKELRRYTKRISLKKAVCAFE